MTSDSSENRQLLEGIFSALSAGDTRPFGEAMTEGFRWRFPGTWSWAREWGTGRAEVQRNLLAPLMAQFATYRARAEEFIADGDRVVVRAVADARTVRGDAYPQAYCYVFGLSHGAMTEVLEYCDTALVERVLRLPRC